MLLNLKIALPVESHLRHSGGTNVMFVSSTYPSDNAGTEEVRESIPQRYDRLEENRKNRQNSSDATSVRMNRRLVTPPPRGSTHPDGDERGGVEGGEQHGVSKHQDEADGQSDLE